MKPTHDNPEAEHAEWWKLSEVAARFRCSPNAVSRLIASGKLKALKGPGGWRVHQSAIDAYEKPGKPCDRPAFRPRVPDVLGVFGRQ